MEGKNRALGLLSRSARAWVTAIIVALAVVAVSVGVAVAHAEAPQGEAASVDQGLASESPAQHIANDDEARELLGKAKGQGALAYAGVTKEETVHASLRPDGGFSGVSSLVTLKNPDGLDVVADRTSLDAIEPSDGERPFAQNGKDLAFDAQGDDVSYSGIPEESLPVGVEVEYRLDGTEVAPALLVGKSGEVSITYRFSNATSTPFAAVGILDLDDERFSDVSVDNGKVMSGTESTTVIGVCFPGLQDQVDAAGFELPGSFTLTAQADDFRLDSVTVLVTPSLFEDLDSLEFDSGGFSGLSDAFDELHGALDELAEGAGSLSSGADELRRGLADLGHGLDQVELGAAASPNDAAETLETLAAQQSSALDDLTGTLEKAELTDEERAEVEASLGQLDAANAGLSEAVTTLRAQDPSAGAQQLVSLRQGIDKAADAAAQLSDGASQLKAGIAAFDTEGIDALEAGMGDVVSRFEGAAESFDNVAARARAYQTFSGKPDGMEGTVLFVYQIDALG